MAVLNLKKAFNFADIYGTLYPVQELGVDVAMVKDIYAKKPYPRAARETTPFSM